MIDSIEERTATLFNWAFGNDADDADRGISQDIEDGFSDIASRLDELEGRQKQQHQEVAGNSVSW